MRKQIFWTLLVPMLILSVAGCSKGGGGTTEAKSYDPCALLTLADAEAALGTKLKIDRHDAKPTNAMGQKICMYGDPADEDMKFVQLSLQGEADMSDAFKSSGQNVAVLFTNLKTFADAPVDVAGLGEAAFFGGSGLKPGAGLTVLAGDKGVLFNVTVGLGRGNADQQAHLDIEKPLAQKALERM
jgi:hypothetical protein